MDLNPIGVAVPFFLLFIAIEVGVAKRRGRRVHRLNDSLADLGCGVTEQVVGLFAHGALVAIYAWVWSRWGVLDFPLDAPLTWAVGMIGVDFFYYWYHRFSHRVHFAWAMHVVHHQSEDYNLAVALRQSAFSPLFSWVFYLPLAVAGLPPGVWATCVAVNLLYQFWIHTELVDRMGWFEWVFNTPSHHRVHHSINARYIDRNHAGMLIVWDRLFGTFEPEAEPCTYGSLSPLESWNPLRANLVPWAELWRASRALPGRLDRWLLWFRPPEWKPERAREAAAPFPPAGFGYDAQAAAPLRPYMLAQFVPAGAVLAALLIFEQTTPLWVQGTGAALLLWTLLTWSGLLEGRSWATALEGARLAALAGCAVQIAASGWSVAWAAALGGFALASAAYLLRCRRSVGAALP
ncbi:MAG: sterol desaturase family protein [Planctomycetota bacterium]|nr:sterol desaturase family protein [Planctomycetota bacterium]